MYKEDVKAMWEAAKLNRAKLEACTKHHFRVNSVLASHVVCTHCGGRCASSSAYAYARGYAAHGGDIADVLTEDLK